MKKKRTQVISMRLSPDLIAVLDDIKGDFSREDIITGMVVSAARKVYGYSYVNKIDGMLTDLENWLPVLSDLCEKYKGDKLVKYKPVPE